MVVIGNPKKSLGRRSTLNPYPFFQYNFKPYYSMLSFLFQHQNASQTGLLMIVVKRSTLIRLLSHLVQIQSPSAVTISADSSSSKQEYLLKRSLRFVWV